jgi:Arc/MetJ-type ribon-helix-helix transcriptional regulator
MFDKQWVCESISEKFYVSKSDVKRAALSFDQMNIKMSISEHNNQNNNKIFV